MLEMITKIAKLLFLITAFNVFLTIAIRIKSEPFSLQEKRLFIIRVILAIIFCLIGLDGENGITEQGLLNADVYENSESLPEE